MKSTVSEETWAQEIKDARTRRQALEANWQVYARLHTNAYIAAADKNDQTTVKLPSGDQVKIGLVYRNIEQTMGLLEVPEIGIRATANDYTEEIDRESTHRESIVEAGVLKSIQLSGLIEEIDEADDVKRDGIIIGHGINYSWQRIEQEEVEVSRIPIMVETDDGALLPETDDDGAPTFEPEMEQQVVFQNVQDERISPLEFLFACSAKKMRKAWWQGFERVESLEELKRQERYHIPSDVKGGKYRTRTLYGEEEDGQLRDHAVKVIKIWDKRHRELLTFLEYNKDVTAKTKASKPEQTLLQIGVEYWPLRFARPEDSPFSFFIPIPASDHPFGISQVEHIRLPALEADKLRTRLANLSRQLKLIIMYKKGRIDPDQLAEAMKAPESKPVGVDLQEGEDWNKLFKEVSPIKIPAELYTHLNMSKDDVREIEGISEIPFGGAETATESENQMAIGGARPNRKRRFYLTFLAEVARRHKDFLRQFAPEGQSLVVPTVDGPPLTLEYGRAAFQGGFSLSVIAGGETVSAVRQKGLLELGAQIFGQFGPKFDLIWLRNTLTQYDLPDINALMAAASEGIPPTGIIPQNAPAGSFNPNDQNNAQAIRAAINAPNEG